MKLSRKSGILLHPTSLPGTPGIGTFGKVARDFVDFLANSKTRLWQVLPLGPTGYGDSPYQSFSTFALNPLLIDLDDLVEWGWADPADIQIPEYIKTEGNVDFGSVVYWKVPLLNTIASRAEKLGGAQFKKEFAEFESKNDFWLTDYALFMSIKTAYDKDGMWNRAWPKELAGRDKEALAKWQGAHAKEIKAYKIIQFFAFRQWTALHEYANASGVEIIGDIPIFVSPDSADVWANQKFFQLNKNGVPKVVAGVPPDYFSPTGQLWGNPLYDWKALKEDNYSWWIKRVEHNLALADYIRIDHFRGFDTYWAVPYGAENAVKGKWLKGPGIAFFNELKKQLGELPLIAEDLGIITDAVRVLRDKTGLPGMKILQFGFDTAEFSGGALLNSFLPHNFTTANCVVYTGTHDNDTTQGSLNAMNDECLCLVASYVKGRRVECDEAWAMRSSGELCRSLVSLCYSSCAGFAIIPEQDLFGFGSDCRMNTPGTGQANWSWRMRSDMLYGSDADSKSAWLKELNILYAR